MQTNDSDALFNTVCLFKFVMKHICDTSYTQR